MAGGDSVDGSKLTGISKIFNGQTMRGRANVSLRINYARLYIRFLLHNYRLHSPLMVQLVY